MVVVKGIQQLDSKMGNNGGVSSGTIGAPASYQVSRACLRTMEREKTQVGRTIRREG